MQKLWVEKTIKQVAAIYLLLNVLRGFYEVKAPSTNENDPLIFWSPDPSHKQHLNEQCWGQEDRLTDILIQKDRQKDKRPRASYEYDGTSYHGSH